VCHCVVVVVVCSSLTVIVSLSVNSLVSINAVRKVDLRTTKNKSSFTSYVDDILSGYSLAGGEEG